MALRAGPRTRQIQCRHVRWIRHKHLRPRDQRLASLPVLARVVDEGFGCQLLRGKANQRKTKQCGDH